MESPSPSPLKATFLLNVLEFGSAMAGGWLKSQRLTHQQFAQARALFL